MTKRKRMPKRFNILITLGEVLFQPLDENHEALSHGYSYMFGDLIDYDNIDNDKQFKKALKGILKVIKGTIEDNWENYKNLERVKGVQVFDDVKGKTIDRYTIIIEDAVYTMSSNPLSPQGFNQYACTIAHNHIRKKT